MTKYQIKFITYIYYNKAPGIDAIPQELLKTGGGSLLKELHSLIIKIWNKEELPQDWHEAVVIPIFK